MVLRKDKLPTLCRISTRPNTSGSGEEGCTSVVDDSECGMTMGSRAKPALNLNNASNKQYASLHAGRGAQRGGEPQGDGR
jgi:hypothetical protein